MAYNGATPADTQAIALGPADIRNNQEGLRTGQIVDAGTVKGYTPGNASGNIPLSNGTVNTNLNADTLDGNHASAFAVSAHTHPDATTSASGLMSGADKTKLNGIATGAEVNQNAFSTITVSGQTDVVAEQKSDTLTLVNGANITITTNATTDTITIAAAYYTHPTGDGNLHVPATSTTNNGKVLKAGATAGSLSWGTLTAADVGALATAATAAAATKLATVRTINGVNFDGTANITITAAAAGGNADTIDTYHAGTGANQVLVLDGSGKVPEANIPTTVFSGTPIGAIVAWPTSSVIPDGWLECNAQIISRTTFSELFGKIGTLYGYSTASDFKVPDLRGEFIRGWDNARGVDPSRALGSTQAEDLKAHIHNNMLWGGGGSGGGAYTDYASGGNNTARPTTSTGGTETRPRNIAMMYIIKAKHVAGSDPVVSGSNAATLGGYVASDFAMAGHTTHAGEAVSLAASGYRKFADGFIIQWGKISVTASITGPDQTFPLAFPVACYGVFPVVSAASRAGSAEANTTGYAISLSQFRINSGQYATPSDFYWFAIGR